MEQEQNNKAVEVKPEGRWAPISAWGYLGIFLLLSIPVVNFILLIVWACGGCKKKNKTRMAQGLLMVFALFILFAAAGTVFLVKNLKSASGVAGLSSLNLTSYTTAAKTLVEHGAELAKDIQSGDMEGVMEVWSTLDTEERTSIMDIATENETIKEAIQNAVLPVPEQGRCYEMDMSCGSDEEFAGYVQLAKTKGFYYADYPGLGYSEEEAIENGLWYGTNGSVCVSAQYVGDNVHLQYLSVETAFGY